MEQNDKLRRLEIFEAEALGFSGQLFRVALRVCRDREQAEDLIQETYL